MFNEDFDPLQSLQDLAEQSVRQAMILDQLAQFCRLQQQQIDRQEARILKLENQTR